MAFTEDGQLDAKKMCGACLTYHLQDMVDKSLAGATEETLASLPVFVDIKEVADLPAGSK